MGRKMAHPIRYDERISLQPYMSQGQHGYTYSLYGVVCHAGGGPNSGHYYAFVKDAHNKWYEMNDESVSPTHESPLGLKNAYILFYLRNKGQELDAAISSVVASSPKGPKANIVAGMKKRKVIDSDDEESNSRPSTSTDQSRFIGPLLPSPLPPSTPKPNEPRPDPQAAMLQKKIAIHTAALSPIKPSIALQNLSQYSDDDDSSEDVGEKVDNQTESKPDSSSKPVDKPSSPISTPSVTPATPSASTSLGSVSTQSFYASSSKPKPAEDSNIRKRKSFDDGDDNDRGRYARTPLTHVSNSSHGSPGRKYQTGNPFNRIYDRGRGGPAFRYGKYNRRRRAGL
jgi:ubiquitin carboxyl-terminal hydrolase 36/42